MPWVPGGSVLVGWPGAPGCTIVGDCAKTTAATRSNATDAEARRRSLESIRLLFNENIDSATLTSPVELRQQSVGVRPHYAEARQFVAKVYDKAQRCLGTLRDEQKTAPLHHLDMSNDDNA